MRFEIIRPGCRTKLRNIEIVLHYLEGKTLKEAGEPYKLSAERTRQIISVHFQKLFNTAWEHLKYFPKYRTDENIQLAKEYRRFLINEGRK